MSIASNIKQLRESHGLTQAQLGDIAGVSDKAVSTWELGTAFPRMGPIQKMADYFKIPKSQLLEDLNEKKLTPEDELDDDLAAMLARLSAAERLRVRDFAEGLLASHEE